MTQIRTDVGTFSGQAAALTAEDTTALTAASSQTTTTEPAVAASGGGGATAGAFAGATERDAAIVTINDTRTRVAENILKLDAAIVRVAELDALQVKILARVKEIEDALEGVNIVVAN